MLIYNYMKFNEAPIIKDKEKDKFFKISDEQLIRIIKSGTERERKESWEKILSNYGNLVFFAINQFIKDEHMSKDLTQETFTRLYEQIKKKENIDILNLKSYLTRSAKNITYNYLKEKSTRNLSKNVSLEHLNEKNINPNDYYFDDKIMEEIFGKESKLPPILEAIKLIPSEQQQQIILLRLKGLSFKTIGEELGIKEDTAKSQSSRGVKQLKEILKDQGLNSISSL